MPTSSQQIRADAGSSLLETVVSLLIGLPLLIALLRTVTVGTDLYLLTTARRVEIESLHTVKSLVGAAVEHTASHRLPVLPRIHPPGRLTYFDGTPHPLSNHPTFRPDNESTALSALELNFEASLGVMGLLPAGARRVCPRWGTKPPTDTRLFLALSIDGVTPVESALSRLSEDSRCFSLVPNPVMSTVLSSRPEVASFATVFVPVIREYTLYLTARGELRYLGHRGTITTENQPILRDLHHLSITERSAPPPLPPVYNATLVFPSGRRSPFAIAPPTSMRKLYTILGARP